MVSQFATHANFLWIEWPLTASCARAGAGRLAIVGRRTPAALREKVDHTGVTVIVAGQVGQVVTQTPSSALSLGYPTAILIVFAAKQFHVATGAV